MAIESLWGDLSELTKVKTPKSILEEQAEVLTRQTGGVLVGRVDSLALGNTFSHELVAVAPTMNNYVYTIVRVEHQIDLYPVKVNPDEDGPLCENEEIFKRQLQGVLASDRVRSALSNLLSQVE